MKIAIIGNKADTSNYIRYAQSMGFIPIPTLNMEDISGCDGLILPGGGDITPAFFGETNHGSRNIDTELDVLQLQALDIAIHKKMPVLGICKGMQIINVGLGGTLIQDLESSAAERHQYDNGDKYHVSTIAEGSWLYGLYGREAIVNSAHHQALNRLGEGLAAIQHCPLDGCVEAVSHHALPIIGVQWHPERIDREKSGTSGEKVLIYFSSLISASGRADSR